MSISLVSISIVGGGHSGLNDDATLDMAQNRPVFLGFNKPTAEIQRPFESAHNIPFTLEFDDNVDSNA